MWCAFQSTQLNSTPYTTCEAVDECARINTNCVYSYVPTLGWSACHVPTSTLIKTKLQSAIHLPDSTEMIRCSCQR